MRHPERVQLIVERSDGSRIARLPAPRWLVSVAVGVAGLSLVALAAVYTDYRLLARHRAEFAALEARTTEQQRLLETLQGRLARIREDIDGWRELHARIWTPFGPDGGPALRTGGVGGPTATLPEPPAVPAASLLEEVERLASVVAEEGESLRALERFIGKAGRVISSLPSRWPVRGPVNSDFGRRVSPWAGGGSEHHSGLDIGAPRGTEVRAPAPGTVVFAGAHAEYGIALIIDHGNDIKTLYGHLQKALVEPGQAVQRGQRIALTGNTGRSSGPHLHYEIQVSGRPVNPRSYLWD